MLAKLSPFLVLFVAFCISFEGKAHAKITTLEKARAELTIPAYKVTDKQLLADQAAFMLKNLYVHRELKVKDFGTKADPLPRLELLSKHAKDLSDADFHMEISRIFSNLHDLHTSYVAPAPLSCGSTFIPVRFESVKDQNRNVVVVSRKLKLQSESVEGIEIGDELITVDGVNVADHLQSLSQISGGANPDAAQLRALQMLSFRSLSTQSAPTRDTMVLKLSNAKGPYEKTVPWFALLNDDCIANKDGIPRPFFWLMMNLAEDEFQKRFNNVFGKPSLVEKNDDENWSFMNPFEDIFEVIPLNTPAGKLGLISIKSFYWQDRRLDLGTVTEAFRRQIENKLSDCIGLVIDVRGNPGGLITFAERLVQLFSPKEVVPSAVKMLANQLNEDIFLRANGRDNRWSSEIRNSVKAGHTYTTPMNITTKSEANSLGQIWFKPVVVLTDAACYSACDMFTAGMQDSDAAVIIGLHRNTGAGGANVMEYKTFRTIMGPINNPFEALPFNQNMRVSWRQTIRSGKHAGELLENEGVKSDVVVSLKREDIGVESAVLMQQIHKMIDSLTPKYTSGLKVRSGNSILLENGKKAIWKEMVYGIDTIEIYVGDKKLNTVKVNLSEKAEEVELSIPEWIQEWSDQPVSLIGKKDGKSVFRAVRELLWRGEYLSIPTDGLKIDFSEDKLGEIKTVLVKGAASSGWQVKDKTLRIGKGPNYESSVHARAFLPLKLEKKGGMLLMDIALSAEEQNDTLRIYATNPDTGELLHIFGGSRMFPRKGAAMPLPRNWDRADFVFEFQSDENWNMTGPEIKNIVVIQ